MPPVLIPVALAAGAATAGVALGVTTVASAVISVGVTAVAAGIGYLNQPKDAETSALDAGAGVTVNPSTVNQQRDITVRQAVPPRRYVYGACQVGGVVFFQENANPYLYIGVAISDGVIEGIDAVRFGVNDVPFDGSGAASPGTIYYTYFDIETALGEPTQAASTILTGAFDYLTSDFRQRGVARAVCRLKWGDDSEEHSALWGDSVSPTFSVRGVKVYDPRDVAQDPDDESTWAYSASPPLAIAHALTHAWGVALNQTAIDWDSFADCADICDATITYNGDSVPLFEIAGIFQAGSDMAGQLTEMLASCGGILIDVDGKVGLRLDGARSSVWTVTDDDILEFGEYVHEGPYDSLNNAIKARFFDAADDGAEATTPVYEITAAQAVEGVRETSLDLRFTAASHSAQILAYRELYRSRAGKRLTLTLSDAALELQALDRITIASTDAAFINGDYEVVQIDLAQFGATVQLREYPADAFADPATYLV